MSSEAKVNIFLLYISTSILFIFFIIILQQTCVTLVANTTRCHRVAKITLLTFFALLLNISYWFAYMYPDYKLFFGMHLSTMSILYEGIVIIFGWHMYRIFGISVIDKIYAPFNMYPPLWVYRYFKIRQLFIIIIVIFCYSLAAFDDKLQWMKLFNFISWLFVFYIIFGSIVIIETCLILWVLSKMLTIINDVTIHRKNSVDMRTAKTLMRLAIYLATFILFVGVAMIVLCTEAIWNWIPIAYNKYLIDGIFHSIMIIIVIGVLIQWIYQKGKWCYIRDESVWIVWCFCGELFAYYCGCCCRTDMKFYRIGEDRKDKLLMEDSGATAFSSRIRRKHMGFKTIKNFSRTPITSINTDNTNHILSIITSEDSKNINHQPHLSVITSATPQMPL
eukprot:86842_1